MPWAWPPAWVTSAHTSPCLGGPALHGSESLCALVLGWCLGMSWESGEGCAGAGAGSRCPAPTHMASCVLVLHCTALDFVGETQQKQPQELQEVCVVGFFFSFIPHQYLELLIMVVGAMCWLPLSQCRTHLQRLFLTSKEVVKG